MPEKFSPSVRHCKLIEILWESKEGISIAELAKKFEVDMRTMRRDLSMLKKQQLVSETTEAHGRKLWYSERNPLQPAQFDFDEAAALYLGYRHLAPLANSFLWKAAQNGLRKIREQLGSQYVQFLDKLLETFRESTTGWSDYSQHSDIISTLIPACEDQVELLITYRSLTAEQEEQYAIHPYELVTQQGTMYVVGFSCKRNEIRTWKLNRITGAERTKEKFKKPKDFDSAKYRRKGFGIFVLNEDTVQKIRIRVDPWLARYVQEHHWHETQKFEQQPDGGVIVQFEVVPTHELINWTLKLGRHAEVLTPESFRETVQKEITEMARRYNQSTKR